MLQNYPKWKYHRSGRSIVVNDADAEAALGEGWSDSPNPYSLPAGSDPRRWFDTWGLDHLSADARGRIKEGLADAHADVVESGKEDGDRVREACMKKAFALFAAEYLDAGLLTESMMKESLPQNVYDAAVSGAWATGTLERNSVCTLRFGHYWVPASIPKMLEASFEAQAWRLRGKLEVKTRSVASESGPDPAVTSEAAADPAQDKPHDRIEAPSHEQVIAERAAIRRAIVMPILNKKRWKPGRLVTKAGIGKNSVYQYLDGTRATITDENRKAIAHALDLEPADLPD